MPKQITPLTLIDRLFLGVLLVIFAGIVVHAPLTIWLGTVFPEFAIGLKAWKELMLVFGAVLLLFIVWRRHRWDILRSPLIVLALLYTALHVALMPLFFENVTALVAGALIDLRFVGFFILTVAAVQLYPNFRRLALWTVGIGALVVGVFALLQVFVLPRDVLANIGYGDTTISPYLTVDENPDYVRINSTLRGPNPLGAYAVIILAMVTAYWLRRRDIPRRAYVIASGVAVLGLGVALWASYSRSALVAAIVALGLVVVIILGKKIPKWVWVSGAVVALFGAVGLYAARDTSFVSNVILHENATTGAAINSNEGHIDSLEDGLARMVRQPLGAGIGSTGSASLYTDDGVIIENQYLFIAHEVGWVGLALFAILFVGILKAAWRSRKDWLAVAVFASGIGLALIGLLLPVWVDDTVSLIWWGLAGIIIGGVYGRTINQKAKRAT